MCPHCILLFLMGLTALIPGIKYFLLSRKYKKNKDNCCECCEYDKHFLEEKRECHRE